MLYTDIEFKDQCRIQSFNDLCVSMDHIVCKDQNDIDIYKSQIIQVSPSIRNFSVNRTIFAYVQIF